MILQVFAMPETALGLFPDIGASYFLSRLPGYFGMLFYYNNSNLSSVIVDPLSMLVSIILIFGINCSS